MSLEILNVLSCILILRSSIIECRSSFFSITVPNLHLQNHLMNALFQEGTINVWFIVGLEAGRILIQFTDRRWPKPVCFYSQLISRRSVMPLRRPLLQNPSSWSQRESVIVRFIFWVTSLHRGSPHKCKGSYRSPQFSKNKTSWLALPMEVLWSIRFSR